MSYTLGMGDSQWGTERKESKPSVNSSSERIWHQLSSWMVPRNKVVEKAQELLNTGHYSYGLTEDQKAALRTKVISAATKIRNNGKEPWPYAAKGGKKTRKAKRSQTKRRQTRGR